MTKNENSKENKMKSKKETNNEVTGKKSEKEIKEKKTEDKEEQIKKLEAEIENYKDKWLRARAEWENFRRRTIKERSDWIKLANQELILELADVLDNFERALEVEDKKKNSKSFYKGIEMIYKQLLKVLEKKGLSKIETVGKEFNPLYHEALAHIETDEYDENIIADTIKAGYKLNDKVIRHAKVAVSKGKKNKKDKKGEEKK